jgi:hypothetical protein
MIIIVLHASLRIFNKSFFMLRSLICLSIISLFISCSGKKENGFIKQGRLEYKIVYLNAQEANYDPSFLPKKMSLEFNQDYSINMIDGFMGLFKLGNITYFKKHRVKTHLKVLDKNYSFDGKRNEMMCCFDCLDGMILKEDTATRVIGGLNSKRVEVSFKNKSDNYDIYYTNDIDLAYPNSTNPYHNISGILTEFRLMMGPYLMEFTATKFDPERSPKEEMNVPVDAVKVNREEMVAILNRLMEQNI